MISKPTDSRRVGLPPFVQPMQHALDRMRAPKSVPSAERAAQARALLEERFGESGQPVITARAGGCLGLLAEHTHYSEGFAVLLPLSHGTAVALRRAERAQVTFKGSETTWALDEEAESPVWVRLVGAALQAAPSDDAAEVAVVSTVPPACLDAYLATLSMAAVHAACALAVSAGPPLAAEAFRDTPARWALARRLLEACTGRPFGIAYLIAADAGQPGTLILIDTATQEHLPVEPSAGERPGWGLLDVGGAPPQPARFYRRRQEQTAEALEQLRAAGFDGLKSFRDLEHRNLEHALEVVTAPLRPLVRHLVTENRRVSKLVAAARRGDWQMLGAVLLMSHASRRDMWKDTTPPLDFVVRTAEAMSMEGIYGARMTGRKSCALVVGRPFVVPGGIDRMAAAFEERFGHAPETMLL